MDTHMVGNYDNAVTSEYVLTGGYPEFRKEVPDYHSFEGVFRRNVPSTNFCRTIMTRCPRIQPFSFLRMIP